MSRHPQIFFYFAAIGFRTEISVRQQGKYYAGSNAFDPKKKVEVKVYLRSSYFSDPEKKLAQKSKVSISKFSKIFIGNLMKIEIQKF